MLFYKYQGWHKIAILCLIFIAVIFLKVCDVKADTVTVSENNKIFSFSKDGFWKPSDSVTHDFLIGNGYGVNCYLDGFTFTNSYIKDLNTGKEYTVTDAISDGIIQDYQVTLSVDDQIEGSLTLFSGKFTDLILQQVKFEQPIFMDTKKQVQFKMIISFNPEAGNEYQNKSYEFNLAPQAHKALYTNYPKDFPDIKYRYIDRDGNWRTDGYFDDKNVWHVPGYWDQNGDFHQDVFKNPSVSDFGNYINGQIKDKVSKGINKVIKNIFKTSDDNQEKIDTEIAIGVFSFLLFVLILIMKRSKRKL